MTLVQGETSNLHIRCLLGRLFNLCDNKLSCMYLVHRLWRKARGDSWEVFKKAVTIMTAVKTHHLMSLILMDFMAKFCFFFFQNTLTEDWIYVILEWERQEIREDWTEIISLFTLRQSPSVKDFYELVLRQNYINLCF